MTTFHYFNSAYDDDYYFPNLDDEYLELEYLEYIRNQEAQRNPKVPDQEEECPNDPGEKEFRHRLNDPATTPISDSVPI